MLLRNRLKKELANLLILKNNEVIGSILFIVTITILISISNAYIKMPEDNGSSGISNYESVMEYPYNIKTDFLQKKYQLKDLNFSFLEEVNIPGMPLTRISDFENKYIFDTGQCLQGLCFTDEFILITSDSDGKGCLGELLVFNKETGEYLVTLGMDEDSHLGGITWDGENIWVCNSSNYTIERISYAFIQMIVVQKTGTLLNVTNLMDVYEVDNSPSGIAYEDGCLWVVTHNIWSNSDMISYRFDKDENTLIKKNSYPIPAQVQGITFGEDQEVYLSISYGRRRSSYICKYMSVSAMAHNIEQYQMLIEMPPCSEGIAINEQMLYVLFESAGERYIEGTDGLGRSLCPIDKILIIDLALP